MGPRRQGARSDGARMTRPEIGNADCRDIELLLRLWHGGSACRDAALDLADRNRRQSTPSINDTRKAEA